MVPVLVETRTTSLPPESVPIASQCPAEAHETSTRVPTPLRGRLVCTDQLRAGTAPATSEEATERHAPPTMRSAPPSRNKRRRPFPINQAAPKSSDIAHPQTGHGNCPLRLIRPCAAEYELHYWITLGHVQLCSKLRMILRVASPPRRRFGLGPPVPNRSCSRYAPDESQRSSPAFWCSIVPNPFVKRDVRSGQYLFVTPWVRLGL